MKILDSDHWIALLCGTLDLRGRVTASEELAITAISVGELVYGAERSVRPEKLLELDTLLTTITIVEYDKLFGRSHLHGFFFLCGALRAPQRKKNNKGVPRCRRP